jgi:hypothetical protein
MIAARTPPPSLEEKRSLDARLRAGVARVRAEQLSVGSLLLALRRLDSFSGLGATTFPQYCESVGLSAREGRELVSIAEAAEVRPEVAEKVASREISVLKAATVAEVIKDPVLQRPGEDPLSLAAQHSARDLRDLVQKRREEARLPQPPVSLRLFVSRGGIDDFQRCRDLLSGSARRRLTEGEAFEGLCEDFLERHDGERKARRLEEKDRESPGPPEDEGNGDGSRKALTAWTKREVLRRFGDRCWVEGCEERAFLYYAHRRPVRAGSGSAPGDLMRLCLRHHRQHDRGEWWPVWRRDGAVVMMDRTGAPAGRFRGPVDDRRPPPRPPP